MRILLDEQLPRQLAPFLVGHDVRTVLQESWAGLKNGALLTAAEDAGFGFVSVGTHVVVHPFQYFNIYPWLARLTAAAPSRC